ncbi:hypothetical protein [Winogradskyella sp.]|uniref:hypothetical protein n=1 Tax=Winogradskyella sp. TaxID=1883156 RepID=UPI003513C8B2
MDIKNKLRRDIWIIIAILLIPVLAYAYLLFPEKEEINILGKTIDSSFYSDFQTYAWVVLQKILLILTLAMWYLTAKNWWIKILLVPLLVFVYQLIMSINLSLRFFDEQEIIFGSILTFPIVCAFYFLIQKIKKALALSEISSDIEIEIEDLINKLSKNNGLDYESFKNKLEEIRSLKPNLNKDVYLKELMYLKDQISA